jgi:hypothetical protein
MQSDLLNNLSMIYVANYLGGVKALRASGLVKVTADGT